MIVKPLLRCATRGAQVCDNGRAWPRWSALATTISQELTIVDSVLCVTHNSVRITQYAVKFSYKSTPQSAASMYHVARAGTRVASRASSPTHVPCTIPANLGGPGGPPGRPPAWHVGSAPLGHSNIRLAPLFGLYLATRWPLGALRDPTRPPWPSMS
jgi:hypothetical protein